jgi:hypothetical protein
LTGIIVARLVAFLGGRLMLGAGKRVGTSALLKVGGRIAFLGARQRIGASKGVGTLTLSVVGRKVVVLGTGLIVGKDIRLRTRTRLITGRVRMIHISERGRTVVVGCPTIMVAVVGIFAAPWPQVFVTIRDLVAMRGLAANGALIVVGVVLQLGRLSGFHAVVQCRIEDDGVEPFSHRHA